MCVDICIIVPGMCVVLFTNRKNVPLWNVLRRAIFNTVYTGTYAFLVILIYHQPYLFTEINMLSMSEMCDKQFIKESHHPQPITLCFIWLLITKFVPIQVMYGEKQGPPTFDVLESKQY